MDDASTIGRAGPRVQPTAMIGRRQEVADVVGLLRASTGAPVTVTGPGGVGKTRLALEVAERLSDHYADGVQLIGIAHVHDPSLVADEVARAFNLAADPGADPTARIVAALRHRHMLIVVDNFEQVIAAAPVVTALSAGCPDVSVLVTSRRRLNLTGERVFELGPLALPAPPRPGGVGHGDPSEVASVALFCDRAALVSSQFEPDQSTLAVIGEICRRLDGLPLAIELVAAYVRLFPVEALLRRLDDAPAGDAFELLRGGPRDTPRRHRDLRAAIDFSYDLLDDGAQRLLRRLSTFDGGWSLDAMDAVCNDGDQKPGGLLDALCDVVDLHLVEPVTAADSVPRFRLLATIRRFARAALSDSGEELAVADRHAEFFAAFAVEAGQGLESQRASHWSAEIDRELPNVRAALDQLAAMGRVGDCLRATAALGHYWLVRGPASEGLRRLEWCLARSEPSPVAANGEAWAGRLAFEMTDPAERGPGGPDRLSRIDRARDALWAYGDLPAYLRATVHLTLVLGLGDRLADAETVATEGLDRCSTPDTTWWQAELLNQQSLAVRHRDPERAAVLADRAIEAARASGHERAWADATFSRLLLDMDRGVATVAALEELFDRCEQIGNWRLQAVVAASAGAVAAHRADPRASHWYFRAVDIGRETRYDRATWWAMSGLVPLAAPTRPSAAARLHGSLAPRVDELLSRTPPWHQNAYRGTVASLTDALGAQECARLVSEGEGLPWDEAVAGAWRLARELNTQSSGDLPAGAPSPTARPLRRRGPRANPELTRRELEILAQLARGHTNQHIADDLGLSPKTVMHHTSNVYRKLAVRGRAQAVAHAVRTGLVAG